MQLGVDISRSSFLVATKPEPVMDPVSNTQRQNKDGYFIFSVQLVWLKEAGAEVMVVKVPDKPNGLNTGIAVRVVGLVAATWAFNDRSGVSFSAERVEVLGE
jgi:hypothetical protein